MARHEALLDIADVIRTYRNGQSLMHHHAARLKKHNRNKRVAVSIAASWNRTDGLGSVVYRALCNPPGRFTGGLPRSGPIFRGWGTLARRRFAAKNRYRPSGLRIAVGCRIRAAPLPLPLLV